MGEAQKKKGFFGKFIDVLSGKPSDSDEESPLNLAPSKKEPVDLTFVKKFTESGGKFLYCEQEDDAYSYLESIVKESGLQNFYCEDSNLTSILSKAGIDQLVDDVADADAFCTSCEFLISFNGGIMITGNQTHGKKLKDLPATFITIARTSQIVENLRSGLTGIRQKYKGDIPSQITTLKGPIKGSSSEEQAGEATCSKEIYLLLLEDQQ